MPMNCGDALIVSLDSKQVLDVGRPVGALWNHRPGAAE